MSRLSASLVASTACMLAFVGSAYAQGMPCGNEIMPLRAAVEKQGMTVKAAIDRKAPPPELCAQLKAMTATESKFVKYLKDNASWCQVPPQAIDQVSASHANTIKIRDRVCDIAAKGPPQRQLPSGPGLSEALGTSRAPTPNTAKSGHGTFDTLTGSPFKQ
jgi:hypothetical protein